MSFADCACSYPRYDGPMSEQSSPPSPAPSASRPLTTIEAARRAGCSRQMLYNLRYYGLGPPAREMEHGRLSYDEAELVRWLNGLGGSIHQVFDWRKLAKQRSNQKHRARSR